jgi:hypothetical protein
MRGKPARPVLRGRGRSNASPLPDTASHELEGLSVTFDDPNLVAKRGLVLPGTVAQRLDVEG